MRILAVTTLLAVLLGGCSATIPVSTVKASQISVLAKHQIYIDKKGRLLNPKTGDRDVNENEYVDYILQNIDAARSKNPDLELLVFIHGGLNKFDKSNRRVKETAGSILAAGKYPLYISWDSGPFTNYGDHLFKLRRGERVEILGPLSSPFVLAEDVLRSVARIPASLYYTLFGQNSVSLTISDSQEAAAARAVKELGAGSFTLHNNPKDRGLGPGHWATIWNPVKLVVAPFVDVLGTGSWNSMLRRTDLVLRKDVAFGGGGDRDSETAASRLFSRLEERGDKMKISIVGHSMGAIVANNIIARNNQLEFSNIVYMAAACSLKDLEVVVAPYLEAHEGAQFFSLTLNPYMDIVENTFYDFVPRGSLLMWIDQTLASTNSFQDRTAGFWFNLVRGAMTAFKNPDIRPRVHLTQFGINDHTPQTHGDFSDYSFWDERFWRGEVH
tara:strand:- start:1309 stop:2634 length:1326 start_codon:yes stop_codon:yes gene_type:complete